MTDVTSSRIEQLHPMGGKLVMLKSGTTVSGGADTLTMTLTDFGFENVLAVEGQIHSTDYSIIVDEVVTTVVSGGILTVSLVDNNTYTDKRRIILVHGE